MGYYKGVFTLLTSCAVRQLDAVTFRRQAVDVEVLTGAAVKYVKRRNKKSSYTLALQVESAAVRETGDKVMLYFHQEHHLEAA